MGFNPDKHHRRSIRLKDYNYSSKGAYFVTVCVQGRECLLGDITGCDIRLNDAGRMVEEVWKGLPCRFPHVELDEYVTMPNHFHGIVIITDDVGALLAAPYLPKGQIDVGKHVGALLAAPWRTFPLISW